MTRGIKVGITGLPGACKTQALVKVIEMLEEESLVVAGMVTEPIISFCFSTASLLHEP